MGHRGTGKTSLLERWKSYCPDLTFADLDAEIEKFENKLITEIFNDHGEAYFRQAEEKIWHKIQAKDVISVGGGFNLDWIKSDRKILWLRRDSDTPERIFLDRPSLSDYKKRFEVRNRLFVERAQLVYTVPEGLFHEDEEEEQILTGNFKNVGGLVTLPYRIYPNTLIEIRDDLEAKIYHTPNLLFSVRTGDQYPTGVKIDWDIKKPIPKGLKPYIISTHGNSTDALAPYEESESILKFCPVVNSWSELMAGLTWQQKNPKLRAFLPRSENGKWSWFRLWMKGKQPLNFWREGFGSAVDQPTLWEWLSHPEDVKSFAAVLGSPIRHSYSPAYHKSFFKNFDIPFYKIHIELNEFSEAFKVLEQLGLVAAAVTSPLKPAAGAMFGQLPINTLYKIKSKWQGANTDPSGAYALLKDFLQFKIVVWGGGGVLRTLQQVAPQASYYSSQKASVRERSKAIDNPEILVWCDPNNSVENIPAQWKPRVVVDLSYHDQSPARIYAQKIKAQYVSGLAMFVAQANEQQTYWKDMFE